MSISYIYIPLAFFTGAIGLLVKNIPSMKVVKTCDERRKDQYSTLAIIAVNIIIILFSAFRQLVALSNDEWAYRRRFTAYSMLSLKDVLEEGIEAIFSTIVWISTRIFSDTQGIIIITGTITIILYLYAIKKYAKDYSFALIMLFLTGSLYSTFNGIQQCMAAAVFMCGIKYIYTRDWKKYLLVILACTLIHSASVILILFYFLANNDFKKFKGITYSLLFLAALIAFYKILPQVIQATGIMEEYYDKLVEGHHGVSIIRIIVNIIPTFIAFVLPASIYKKDRMLNTIANISLLNSIIYVASFIDTYIARFALFTTPFNALLLANIVDYFNKEGKVVYKVVASICYTIFCYVEIRTTLYNFNFVF